VMIAVPLYYYNLLPDEIPRHYNFAGRPDGFGPRGLIWVLPVIGIATFLLFSFLPRLILKQRPDKHSNPDEFHLQQKGVTLLLDMVNASIMVSFAYITVMGIQVALGNAGGLGVWFMPAFLILMVLLPLIYSLFLIQRKTC
ncbi:MAG: DUF1648 domain-containing protein, partial [Bacteroidales bacterium]